MVVLINVQKCLELVTYKVSSWPPGLLLKERKRIVLEPR